MKTSKKNPPRDASRPLNNKRQELFCELLAFECWGSPEEAAARAGYQVTQTRMRQLLCNPDLNDRLRCLRKRMAEQTVADELWLKSKFIDIAVNADKPADKLRALATLYRAVLEKDKTLSAAESAQEDDPLSGFGFGDSDDEL